MKIIRFWNDRLSTDLEPEIDILPCRCGAMPECYDSCGGFNYYRYYKCPKCSNFVKGFHEFPVGVYSAMSEPKEMSKTPKLFVRYKGEPRAERAWNKLVSGTGTMT